ncbi:MAG: tyrosine-type recombinase/integrase [Candidatus Methylomirabilales bacterium]
MGRNNGTRKFATPQAKVIAGTFRGRPPLDILAAGGGPPESALTVGEMLQAYQRARLHKVKNRVAILYAVEILTKAFGAIPAEALLPETIDQWGAEMVQGGYAEATVDRLLANLRAAYHLAVLDRRVPYMPRISLYCPDNARQGFCEPAEYQAILAQIKLPVIADMAELAYNSGRRPSELEKMRWADVYREEGVIRLPQTKNRRPWLVPLAGPIAAIIDRREAARTWYREDGQRFVSEFVFHIRGKHIRHSHRNYVWRNAAAAAGFPKRLFYDLRRTAGRDMVSAGIDPTTVKQALGHVTDSMFHRYNIRNFADQLSALERLVAFRQAKKPDNGGPVVAPHV